MKKITILSVVAAAVLFTGCGEDTEKIAAEATVKAVESTKEVANNAVKEVSDSATKVVEATKDVASKAVESAKDSVAAATTVVADTVANVAGAAAYAKCAGCHGVDGKTIALGKSPVIAGQSKEELVTKLKGYKDGTINVSGMGNLMKGQVASMNDADIDAVSSYVSTLK